VIRSRKQQDIANLVDLYTPLTDYDKLVLLNVYGMGPLEPQAKVRQPYDSLYLKMKRSQEI
jgi:hypothetical protein